MNSIDSIAAFRVSEEVLEMLWSPGEQAAALDRILGDVDTATGVKHRRRRTITVGLPAAAAAVAAAVFIPIVAPSGGPGGASPAAAAELTRLAHVAATSPSASAGPGQFLHLLVDERMSNRLGVSGGTPTPGDHVVLESWTSYDGTIWRRDINNPNPVNYYKFPPGGDNTAAPSPAYLDSLPTDPAKLEKLLRHNPDEPNSSDGAIFTAVGDMLRGGFAPPALRTALMTVLEHLHDVNLGPTTTDALGRPAVQFTIAGRGSLFFDPATAQIIEESDSSMGFISIVKTANIVDTLPGDVLKNAPTQR